MYDLIGRAGEAQRRLQEIVQAGADGFQVRYDNTRSPYQTNVTVYLLREGGEDRRFGGHAES